MAITVRTQTQKNKITAVVTPLRALAELADAITDQGTGRADPAQDRLDLEAAQTALSTAAVANMGALYRADVANAAAQMVEIAVAALEGDLLDSVPNFALDGRAEIARYLACAIPLISRSVCGR